jgi:hypothetical protein
MPLYRIDVDRAGRLPRSHGDYSTDLGEWTGCRRRHSSRERGSSGAPAGRGSRLGRAPLRTGDRSVAPSGLGTGREVEVTVTVHLPSGDETRTFQVGSLSYSLDDTAVAYESNAVFRRDGDGVAVLSPPPMACDPDRTVVSFTALNATGPTSIAAESVTVVGRHEDTSLWYPFNRTGAGSADQATGVSVDVDSSNGVGWDGYFERAPGWTDPDGDGTYTCDTDRVFVRQVNATTRLV